MRPILPSSLRKGPTETSSGGKTSKHTSFNHMKVLQRAGGSRTSQENSAITKRPQTREQVNGRNDKSCEVVQILTLINTCPLFPVALRPPHNNPG